MSALRIGIAIVAIAFIAPLILLAWLKWIGMIWDWLCGYES